MLLFSNPNHRFKKDLTQIKGEKAMNEKNYMEERYAINRRFCQNELLNLVRAIYSSVIRIDYEVHNGCTETVTIVSGENGEWKKTINVTSNNLLGIAIDVLQNL